MIKQKRPKKMWMYIIHRETLVKERTAKDREGKAMEKLK